MKTITLYGGPLDGEVREVADIYAAMDWLQLPLPGTESMVDLLRHALGKGPPPLVQTATYRKVRLIHGARVRYLWVSEDVQIGSLTFSWKG